MIAGFTIMSVESEIWFRGQMLLFNLYTYKHGDFNLWAYVLNVDHIIGLFESTNIKKKEEKIGAQKKNIQIFFDEMSLHKSHSSKIYSPERK